MDDKISHYMILWFFLGLFLVSFFMLGWLLKPFVPVIILAAVLTGVCNPFYRLLLNKVSPTWAALIACTVIFLLLLIPIVFFVSILSQEAYDLYLMGKNALVSDRIKDLLQNSTILDRTSRFLAGYNIDFGGEEVNQLISEATKIVGLFLYKQVRLIGSNALSFLINFFLMLLIIYYLLIDGQRLVSFIIDLSPLPKEQDEKLIEKFKNIAGAILIGNGFCGLLQGFLGGLVFSIFGLESPVMWGTIMALLAFLPIVGVGAVFIPAAIYLFLVKRIAAGIFFIVFYVILSAGIEYILKPRLVGKQVQMHTLLVFFSIIGGLKLFGLLGIIYGPLVVTGFLTLTDIYHSSYQGLVTNNRK